MMFYSRILIAFTFVILYSIQRTDSCANGHGACASWGQFGECYMNPGYMMCACSLACQTPSECAPQAGEDTVCNCRLLASMRNCEDDPTTVQLCPKTCFLRQNVSCSPLETPANTHADHPGTKYMEEVTMSCDDGFEQIGGFVGRHVCKEDGDWQQSVYSGGQVPICKPLGWKSQKMILTALYTECVSVANIWVVRSRLQCMTRCEESGYCVGALYNNATCSVLIADSTQSEPCITENVYIKQ